MITTRIDVRIWDNSIKHKISFTVTKKKEVLLPDAGAERRNEEVKPMPFEDGI